MKNKLWVKVRCNFSADSPIKRYAIAAMKRSISGKIAPNATPTLNSLRFKKLAKISPERRCIPPCTKALSLKAIKHLLLYKTFTQKTKKSNKNKKRGKKIGDT